MSRVGDGRALGDRRTGDVEDAVLLIDDLAAGDAIAPRDLQPAPADRRALASGRACDGAETEPAGLDGRGDGARAKHKRPRPCRGRKPSPRQTPSTAPP